MASTYPQINGHAYDYSSIEIDINGTIYVGVKEISWNQTMEKGKVRGTNPQVLARTRGEYEAEGSITMYPQEYTDVITALGDGYMEQQFNVVVSYSEVGQNTQTIRLLGCEIKSEESGGSQGTDPLEDAIDIDIIQVERNGLRAVANALI